MDPVRQVLARKATDLTQRGLDYIVQVKAAPSLHSQAAASETSEHFGPNRIRAGYRKSQFLRDSCFAKKSQEIHHAIINIIKTTATAKDRYNHTFFPSPTGRFFSGVTCCEDRLASA